jgi:hypothetical protein
MVKTSTAAGWPALVLAAQVAISPVAASPLNVIAMPLLERTHSAGQKRDHHLSTWFYSEASCQGPAFLNSDTGSTPDAGETSCLALYDPSNGNQRCAKAAGVWVDGDTWSGRGYVLTLYQNAQCNGDVHENANTDPQGAMFYCYTLPDHSCFNSARMAFY